jgi:hypothetical protein
MSVATRHFRDRSFDSGGGSSLRADGKSASTGGQSGLEVAGGNHLVNRYAAGLHKRPAHSRRASQIQHM